MGAWGIRALESDNGLDVIDYLCDYTAGKEEASIELQLAEVIEILKGNLLGRSPDEIDFLYDNTAMALAELYLAFHDQGYMDYDHAEPSKNLRKRVTAFPADLPSLEYLSALLSDIRNEVPDQDGEREIVELWRDSNS